MLLLNRIKSSISSIDALLLIVVVIVLNRFTDWLPSHYYIHPFPFYEIIDSKGNEIGITIQSYFFMVCLHFVAIFYWNHSMKRIPNKRVLYKGFRTIEILSLFDFGLIYEKAFIHIGDFNIQFTDFKILFYATLYILCKTGKL